MNIIGIVPRENVCAMVAYEYENGEGKVLAAIDEIEIDEVQQEMMEQPAFIELEGWSFDYDVVVFLRVLDPKPIIHETLGYMRGIATHGEMLEEWEVYVVDHMNMMDFLCPVDITGRRKAIQTVLTQEIGIPGTEQFPGPTYGVNNRAWYALGAIHTWIRKRELAEASIV